MTSRDMMLTMMSCKNSSEKFPKCTCDKSTVTGSKLGFQGSRNPMNALLTLYEYKVSLDNHGHVTFCMTLLDLC